MIYSYLSYNILTDIKKRTYNKCTAGGSLLGLSGHKGQRMKRNHYIINSEKRGNRFIHVISPGNSEGSQQPESDNVPFH